MKRPQIWLWLIAALILADVTASAPWLGLALILAVAGLVLWRWRRPGMSGGPEAHTTDDTTALPLGIWPDSHAGYTAHGHAHDHGHSLGGSSADSVGGSDSFGGGGGDSGSST